MAYLMLFLALVPLVTAALCVVVPSRVAGALTIASSAISLALAVALVEPAGQGPIHLGVLRADALSVVFLLATGFLYFTTALYSVGYLKGEADSPHFHTYARRFHVGINLFAWSMLCAPLMDGLAMLWVAIEVTTVISALLVAIEDTDGATEAAWKYVLIASSGLGIALLATVFMYYAGAQSLGSSFALAFEPLLLAASTLPAAPVKLAFVLAVLGYGTKVGLVPVHTWLPDAHAEAPTPISAMLSGSLLAVSFYAVIRYYEIAVGALGGQFPQAVLLVFGVASLLLASLYLLGQQDVKRLLAYSSVEHMGILTIGVSFGAPVAAAGVLLHVLAHAAGKGGAFMGAGVMVRAYRTKELARIRDGLRVLPWSAPLFLLLIFGLSGFPPSGIFRSEFQIVAGGLAAGHHTGAVLLVVLVTLAFFGLAVSTTRMICAPGSDDIPAGEPSRWMIAPVLLCLAVLVLLGVHPPASLSDLLTHAAAQMSGGAA